jgi:hypothetical protein
VDLVAAGQAFHWFDQDKARHEFRRVLRSGGRVALFWNVRRLTGDAFAEAYEHLLLTYGTDYTLVSQRRIDAEALAGFFRGPFERHTFPYIQTFDFEGLRGRLLSSSYAPATGHPQHAPMIEALKSLFQTHEQQGRVHVVYDTNLYIGRV